MPKPSQNDSSQTLDWMVRQLIDRDPLGQDLSRVEAIIQNILRGISKQELEPRLTQQQDLEDELRKKYHVPNFRVTFDQLYRWDNYSAYPAAAIFLRNWPLPVKMQCWASVSDDGSTVWVGWKKQKRIQTTNTIGAGPPFLEMAIDLSRATKKHLEQFAKQFKRELDTSLQQLPKRFRHPPGRRPRGRKPSFTIMRTGTYLRATLDLSWATLRDFTGLAKQLKVAVRQELGGEPRLQETKQQRDPLYFLEKIRRKTFERDLKRYDLHIIGNLLFRDIVRLERGITIDRSTMKKVESGVRTSVTKIFTAIHRRPYRARRRRIDNPAAGIPPFLCTVHGGDCHPTCPELQDWYKKVTPSLPGDLTGRSWLEDSEESYPD